MSFGNHTSVWISLVGRYEKRVSKHEKKWLTQHNRGKFCFEIQRQINWITCTFQKNCGLGKNWINSEFTFIYNKTAGHHRHIFRPLFLLKIPFSRIKAFSRKNTTFYNFWLFSISDIFWFPQNNFNSATTKDTFLKFYHLIRILHQICNLYQFQKTQFWK